MATPKRYGGYGGNGGYGGHGGYGSSPGRTSLFTWPTVGHVHFWSDGYYGDGRNVGFVEVFIIICVIIVIYLIVIKYAAEVEADNRTGIVRSSEHSLGGSMGYQYSYDEFWNGQKGQDFTIFVTNAIENKRGYWEFIK